MGLGVGPCARAELQGALRGVLRDIRKHPSTQGGASAHYDGERLFLTSAKDLQDAHFDGSRLIDHLVATAWQARDGALAQFSSDQLLRITDAAILDAPSRLLGDDPGPRLEEIDEALRDAEALLRQRDDLQEMCLRHAREATRGGIKPIKSWLKQSGLQSKSDISSLDRNYKERRADILSSTAARLTDAAGIWAAGAAEVLDERAEVISVPAISGKKLGLDLEALRSALKGWFFKRRRAKTAREAALQQLKAREGRLGRRLKGRVDEVFARLAPVTERLSERAAALRAEQATLQEAARRHQERRDDLVRVLAQLHAATGSR